MRLAAWFCVLALCPFALAAFPSLQPEVTPTQPAGAREPRELAAREIARLAMLDLRGVNQPTTDDYRAALILLGIAHDLDPKNTEIIRRQIEAAHNGGDQDAVIEHTRSLLFLDPTDTIATLRFISYTISSRSQNIEDRLHEYETYLTGSKKDAVDASIRSRLALDAAMLLRERGDEKGFKDKLVLAMQLDPTHKEAAVLAATYFSEQIPDDPIGRMDLLLNILKADPLDPNVHQSIARELAVAGAYVAAERFHNNALTISSIVAPLGDTATTENLVLKWYSHGPAEIMKQLDETVATERDAAARKIRRLIEDKKPTEGATKPEEVRLSGGVMAVYILATDAAGDRIATQSGVKDLSLDVDRLIAQLQSSRTRGTMTEEAAVGAMLEVLIQLNTLRLWVNVDIDKYTADPNIPKAIQQAYPDASSILDALMALRAGKPQEAIDLCQDLTSNRMARIATAMAHEALGAKDKAIEVYLDLVHDEPFQPASAWARSRALALGAVEDTKLAKSLEKLVAPPRVPAWMDRMAMQPNQFIRVTVSVPAQETSAVDAFPLTISITNQSPIPLALGPDRPISSRFLLVPKPVRLELADIMQPEVIDIDQRLRLMPRETMTVKVWPTPGITGWVMDCLANRSVRARWRLIQGFLPDFQEGMRPGPMCLVSESDAFLVTPLGASSLSPEQVAQTIADSPADALVRLACVTRALALQPWIWPDDTKPRDSKTPTAAPPLPPNLKLVASAFAARYATLSPITRATLAVIIPHKTLAPDLADFDASVRADQDPVVRCIALCTRVTDAKDELLATAKADSDPRVSAIAAAVEARLQAGAQCYASLTAAKINPPNQSLGNEKTK